MNWGHQLKELITRNWREKIISLVLAFLFWFMIKAQDARQALPYSMPPPSARIPQPTSPAPPQLTPVIPPPAQMPPQLEPTLPSGVSAPAPAAPGKSGEAIKGAAGL